MHRLAEVSILATPSYTELTEQAQEAEFPV